MTRFAFALAALPFAFADSLDQLRALPVVSLQGETYHVQGIDVHGSTLWVSAVDVKKKRGLLFTFDRKTGKLIQSTTVHSGVRYHPGGISLEGNSVWVPVAEYRRSSTTTIQKRNRRTLALESEFVVDDHIGALAVVKEGLLGANWDAREFYLWTLAGKQLRRITNPTGLAIQDMKYRGRVLIAGGLQRSGAGTVVWLEWPSLRVSRTMHTGRTDRGVAFTHEGLAIRGRTLYLLPEDGPSRLFAFELP